MKYRIARWAGVGLLVVVCWNFYAMATFPDSLIVSEPLVWLLIRITCPIVFVGTYFHFGIGIYWVLLANAATYALVGLIFEAVLGKLRRAR